MLIAFAPPRRHDEPVAPRNRWLVEEARIHDTGGTNGAWPDAFFVAAAPAGTPIRALAGYPFPLYLGGLVRTVQRGSWLPDGLDGSTGRHMPDYLSLPTVRVLSATPAEQAQVLAILARMREVRTRLRRGRPGGREANYVIPWGLD